MIEHLSDRAAHPASLRRRFPAKSLHTLNRTPRPAVVAAQLLLAAAAATLLIWPEWAPGISILSLALLLLFLWSLVSWKVAGRSLFSPYILFLTSAFLFNAGQAFLEVFGLNDRGMLQGVFDEPTLTKTLVLIFTGLSGLHAAALLGAGNSRLIDRSPNLHSRTWMRGIGWLLVMVALPPTVLWLAQAMSIASASGYGALYDRDLQTGLASSGQLLSGWLVPGLFFLTVSGRTHRLDSRVATTLIIGFVLAQLYVGYRSTAVMPLLAWAWLRHRAVKPMKMSMLACVGLAMLIFVFPLIRETRGLSKSERSLATLGEWFDPIDNPAVSSVSEMGGTMRTIAYTVTLVPTTRPYDRGLGYLYASLTLFPNLFWRIHPTVAHGLYDDWLVSTVDPWNAARGGGYGFSFIAEAFINFGAFGPLVVLFVLGLLFGRLSAWADRIHDPATFALVATILAITLRYPRDEFTSMLRPIAWFAVGPYLAAHWLPKLALGAIRTRPSSMNRPSVQPRMRPHTGPDVIA